MSTTEAALAPPAATAPRASRLERWGDALNPILVKEVRQALRGRYFRISFWVTLGAAVTVATLLILVNSVNGGVERSFGITVFCAMFFCLAAATHGLVPFSAFVSMGSEWEENTFDLLVLSNLRPRQIVLGKILSAGVQALLFYSAFGPFLVLAFLLHGVDLLAASIALGGSALLSLTLACFAVALSSLTRHKFLRVVLMGGLAALLVAASFQPGLGVFFMMHAPGEVHQPKTQQIIGMILTVMLGFGGLCFAVACTRLAHPEENRSSSLRIWALAILVCFLAWVTWIFDGGFGDEDVLIPCFFSTALIVASTWLFASEPERLGRRVRAQVPRGRLLSWLAAPLLPGGARGVGFYLLATGLLYAWAYGVTTWSNGAMVLTGEERLVPPVLGLFGLFFATAPPALFSRRLELVSVRILCRVAAILILIASIFLPALYGFFVRDSDWMRFMHPFNPFAVVERLWAGKIDRMSMGLAVPVVLGLVALAVNAPRLWRSYRELEEARAARVAQGALTGAGAAVPAPSREALRLAEVWRLVPPAQPPRAAAGEHLGGGSGSSLEFQDRRTYAAGDDLRHLDWRAFARTGQLFVKLYREEVLPRFDLLVDVSRSMGVEPGKAALTVDLAALLAVAGRAAGLDLRLVLLGRAPRVVELDAFLAEGDALGEREPLDAALASAAPLLRHGSLRLLVSDFLSPLDPALLVRRVAARGGGFVLLHVLGEGDLAPPAGEALRLIDAESDEELELLLDADTVARYLARLERLREGLAAECRRVGARYVELEAGTPLEELCRERLARAEVLAV